MFDFSKVRLFAWEILYYEELENEIGVSAFNLLSKNQEAALAQAKNEFNDALKNDADYKSMEPEDRGSYYQAFYEREELAIRELQRRQRYSLLLSLHSYFEGRLNTICSKIEEEFKFKIKITDLSGNDDLMRYWNYLEKVFDMEMKTLETFFTPIKQNKQIRNIVAHHNGCVSEELKNKIGRVNGLSFNDLGGTFQIQIDNPSYILLVLDKMDLFLATMLEAIDTRYKKIKTDQAHKVL